MIITPNKGPKKAPKVSTKDKMPIWLKKIIQKTPINKPNKPITKLELLNDKKDGIKLIIEYWEGIKFAIKFVDIEAIKIKTKTKLEISKLFSFPIISDGFVRILDMFSESNFKNASAPVTMNKVKKEKIIKFKIKLKFPFFNSFSFLTYLEKSPKLKMIIEK